jgi:hypothetical protein
MTGIEGCVKLDLRRVYQLECILHTVKRVKMSPPVSDGSSASS